MSKPTLPALLSGFAIIYVVWGSTYLAIRFAIETLPPFLMAGVRFLVAGVVLYAWARARGSGRPTRRHVVSASILGALMLWGGNGGVVWAEQRIPSGLAALLVSTVPLFVVLLDAFGVGSGRRLRPRTPVLLGVVGGLLGVGFLLSPGDLLGGGEIDLLGAAVVLFASLSWAVGSLVTRRAELPESPYLTTALEMLAGGALLFLTGWVVGEPGRIGWEAVSLKSLLALGYLIVFGSLIAFTAYVWLLRVADTAKVATYAYVNPVVAILLGWGLAGEELTGRTLLAAAIILASVASIISFRSAASPAPAPAADADPVEAPTTPRPPTPSVAETTGDAGRPAAACRCPS